MKRYGEPEPSAARVTEARLLDRIDKDGAAPCWQWAGPTATAFEGAPPYGIFNHKRAHRVAWEIWRGPIPARHQIDHLCRNTLCVNPEHLEPVTPRENLRRAYAVLGPDGAATFKPRRRKQISYLAPGFVKENEDRFWPFVQRDSSTGCWLWTGRLAGAGYGTLSARSRKLYAHRFAYTLLVGEIPPGAVLDHLCRVKTCVNPAHLEPVTERENTRRAFLAMAAE